MRYEQIVCALIVSGCASSATGRPFAAPMSARLRLELSVKDQPALSLEEDRVRRVDMQYADLPVELTLSNESERELWVNARLSVAWRPAFPGMAEVNLDVTGPEGAVAFTCMPRYAEADPSAYRILKPGERVTVRALIPCPGALNRPGLYTAQATYQDGNAHAPAAPPGTERMIEAVASGPVQFRVISK
jgi:hypothetical protein